MSVEVPEGLDWYIWRVVGSNKCSGLYEIAEHWSLDDLVHAHMALDVEDELQAVAEERAERERRRAASKGSRR